MEKRLVLFSIPCYLFASLLLILYFQGASDYNSFALSLRNVLTITWVLLYYRSVFTGLKIIKLNREPFFWIATGLLFYSLGSFFIDGLMPQLLKRDSSWAGTLIYVNIFLGYFLFITFIVAFILERKNRSIVYS